MVRVRRFPLRASSASATSNGFVVARLERRQSIVEPVVRLGVAPEPPRDPLVNDVHHPLAQPRPAALR